MKKGKLYTVTPWNKQALVKVEPLPTKNLFWPGGGIGNYGGQQIAFGTSNYGAAGNPFTPGTTAFNHYNIQSVENSISNGSYFNNPFTGIKNNPTASYTGNVKGVDFKTNFNDPVQRGQFIQNSAENGLGNWKNAGVNDNGNGSKGKSKGMSAGAQQAIALGASALGSIDTGEKRGMWDTLDPVHHLAGGRETGFGNAMEDAGVALTQAGLSSGNYYLAIAGAAAKVVGGLSNAAFGYKIENEKGVKDNIAHLKNVSVVDGDLDSIQKQYAQAGIADIDVGDVKNGWFNNKGDEEAEKLTNQQDYYKTYAEHMFTNAANNYKQDQLFNALKQWSLPGSRPNQSAYGGPLDIIGNTENDMSAVNYGFMSDYLTERKRQNDLKNKMVGMTQIPNFINNGYAIGGDLQTNGSDFPTGLTYVNAGGSHEENPYDGVQMGVDPQGVPNLVEEGETVFNDYVYSTRIPIDDITKERFHIGKKREMTYADLSKKLEKEVSERPNDPISQAAFKAQMADLAEEQERQKAEMEAARAREAFEALSPEEQTALMQQAAQQEQMVQEQAMQEQAMAEQAAAEQQPTPEEIAMAEQQQHMMQGVPTADAMGTVATAQPVMACGGKMNKFDEGGKKNVGKWKDDKENHWDVFTKPGLRKYIENVRQKLKMAPDEETKNAIRRDAMNELNTLQQSYYDYVREGAANPTHGYSDDILRHQQMFDRLYGNTGFYTTDENGNVRNLIAESIDLPNGAATEDKPSNWVDGYNGPRTSIRNFGSTAYGDNKYYQDLVDEFAGLGLTYAPNKNWKYGENELYGLSIPESTPAEGATAKAWDWNSGSWVDKPQEQPAAENAGTTGNNGNNKPAAGTGDDREVVPIHRNENWRYAGLLGPAVGLGMQALGIGRPDTSGLEAAANSGGNYTTASWMPIGDYMRYTPLDRLFEGNRIQANARATDRNLMNTSGGNRGTAMAGLLANGYNTQIALGTADRQGDESNWNKYAQTKTFNRGTNQFNAEAFNRNSEFNTNAYNNAARSNAQMKLHAAQAKMDADAGWYNGIYGNVSGLLKGIGDMGRENAQRNMISDMAATGLFGQMTPNTYIANGMLRYETDEERAKRLAKQKHSVAKGGKIKKKKGFTY